MLLHVHFVARSYPYFVKCYDTMHGITLVAYEHKYLVCFTVTIYHCEKKMVVLTITTSPLFHECFTCELILE